MWMRGVTMTSTRGLILTAAQVLHKNSENMLVHLLISKIKFSFKVACYDQIKEALLRSGYIMLIVNS